MLGKNLWEPPPAQVSEAFERFSVKYDIEFFREIGRQVEDPSALALKWFSATDLANFILELLKAERPASLIRLSDGEGNLLGLAHPEWAESELMRWCARRISYIHFGDHTVVEKNPEFFGRIVSEASANADVIGFAEFESCFNSFSRPPEDMDVRAIVGNRLSLLHLREKALSGSFANLSSAWFSRWLLPHYRSILQASPRILIISSYPELRPLISNAFCIPPGKITDVNVPTQAVFVATKERRDTKHFPTGMEQVLDSLKSLNEYHLVVVAAGLLGKLYCSEAKRMGSLALDIGSIAEIWLGKVARGLPQSYVDKWRL